MAVNDDGRGPLRKLLGKVVGRVVDAALGTGRPPPPEARPAPTHRASREAPEVVAPRPVVDPTPPPPALDDGTPVAVAAVGDDAIRLSWTLSDDDLARARRVLGEEGELSARLVVVARDEAQVVSSHIHDKPGVGAEGEWLVEDLPEGARCAAAVGLRHGERFVSAAHARVLVL